jgi:hypothetical protein
MSILNTGKSVEVDGEVIAVNAALLRLFKGEYRDSGDRHSDSLFARDFIAHLQSQLDECRKVVVAKDRFLEDLLEHINARRANVSLVFRPRLIETLATTPADLASKVLVERSEWETLVASAKRIGSAPAPAGGKPE